MLLQVANFSGRSKLACLLNELNLQIASIEIGTHRGVFAFEFLSRWGGKELFCVDPWLSGYDNADPASNGDREEDKKAAEELLQPYADRVIILQKTSQEATRYFLDGSIDFVYIDGCHRKESVAYDLAAWWPKLREGGILAGHDIICPEGSDQWGEEVQPAVFNFAKDYQLTLYLIEEERPLPWSYYMKK